MGESRTPPPAFNQPFAAFGAIVVPATEAKLFKDAHGVLMPHARELGYYPLGCHVCQNPLRVIAAIDDPRVESGAGAGGVRGALVVWRRIGMDQSCR